MKSYLCWTFCWFKFWIKVLPLAIVTVGWSIYWDYTYNLMKKTKKEADFYLRSKLK